MDAAGGAGRALKPGGVLLAGLVLLALARIATTLTGGMHLWGVNHQRFVDPMTGWVGWALMALALLPPLARRAAPALERAGDALARGGAFTSIVAALGVAALVWFLPDRVRFVGDFLLRQGTVMAGELPSELFPQALPLDVFLHYTLPLWLAKNAFVDANTSARMLGAAEAALLGVLAVRFVRTLSFNGAAATAAFSIVVFGGYLGMFTGYSKAFADLVIVVAAVGVFGVSVMRGGGGLLGLGVALAIGLTLHRSALGLLPAAALAWIVWLRANSLRALKAPAPAAALAIPLATLAIMLPRIIGIVLKWDRVHFAPAEVVAQGGTLAAAFAGTRALDLLNLALMLSPLAVLVPALLVAFGRALPRGRDAMFLAAVMLPLIAFWPLIHPVHGMHRDWDDFSFTGVALSLLAAWCVGEALRGTPRGAQAASAAFEQSRTQARARATATRRRPAPAGPARAPHGWLAVPVVFATVVPTLQWLGIHNDLERGLVRVAAFVTESPRRTDAQRGHTWDFLGIRNFDLERYDAAARAFENAAETAPSPRILQQWAAAETQRGDFRKAQRLYWRMLSKAPDMHLGWLGLATVSSRFGDISESRRAAREILRLLPGNREALSMLAYWDQLPPAMRDSLEQLYPPRDDAERLRWMGE